MRYAGDVNRIISPLSWAIWEAIILSLICFISWVFVSVVCLGGINTCGLILDWGIADGAGVFLPDVNMATRVKTTKRTTKTGTASINFGFIWLSVNILVRILV